MKRIASLKALVAAFPSVDPAKLALVRTAWRSSPDAFAALIAEHAPKTDEWVRSCFHKPARIEIRRRACDELLDMHGVEYVGVHRRSGSHVYYCNSGDTYDATLIFHGNNAYIGCWGDLIERRQVRERETL